MTVEVRMIPSLPDLLIEPVVRLALAEDLGRTGDVTARACIPEGSRLRAAFVARKPGVLAGIDCVRLAVLALDPAATVEPRLRDGATFEAGATLVEVEADARALLAAERTALNLLGRLCGVATLTRTYVEAVAGTGVRIADTRKTTPGLRMMEKHAVTCGGGLNHRLGLDNGVMIKDNHIAVCGSITAAVERARKTLPVLTKLEVECDRLEQVEEAVKAGADVIMLDNMSVADMTKAVGLIAGRAKVEASGGIRIDTIGPIAQTGVDYISTSKITQSAPAVDIGLDEA